MRQLELFTQEQLEKNAWANTESPEPARESRYYNYFSPEDAVRIMRLSWNEHKFQMRRLYESGGDVHRDRMISIVQDVYRIWRPCAEDFVDRRIEEFLAEQ